MLLWLLLVHCWPWRPRNSCFIKKTIRSLGAQVIHVALDWTLWTQLRSSSTGRGYASERNVWRLRGRGRSVCPREQLTQTDECASVYCKSAYAARRTDNSNFTLNGIKVSSLLPIIESENETKIVDLLSGVTLIKKEYPVIFCMCSPHHELRTSVMASNRLNQ